MSLALSAPEPRRDPRPGSGSTSTLELPPPLPAGGSRARARERRIARRTTALVAWSGAVSAAAAGYTLAGGAWTREALALTPVVGAAIAALGTLLDVRWRAASAPGTWWGSFMVAVGTAAIVCAALFVSGRSVEPGVALGAVAGAWLTWTITTFLLSRAGQGWLTRARTHVALVAPRSIEGSYDADEVGRARFELAPATPGVTAMPEPVVWSHLQRRITTGEIDRVVFADPAMDRDDLMRAGQWCADQGVEAHLVSSHFEVLRGRTRVPTRWGEPVFVLRPATRGNAHRVAKRTLDVVGSALGLICLSPLFALLAVLVRRSSPGPVLFRQARVGRGGKEFNFLKFRSMRTGTSSDVHEAYIKKLASGGEAAAVDKNGQKIFKIVNDPRITPVGHFIRRTSLDELPQLVNVLRGEMSLCGPRPSVAYELDVYKDWHRRRMDATPGCTGLWQVTGRSAVDFDEMMVLDLHYVSNATPLDDLRLIALTVPVMVLGRGGM